MEAQVSHIMRFNWDNLIILDACRYDVFEIVYKKYLRGKLKKVLSPASDTQGWLKALFGNKRLTNVVYVSAHPYVNSKGIAAGSKDAFNAVGHFYKIIDVWDYGWDRKYNTVPPLVMNEAVLQVKKEFPGKKIIAHYLQPHTPYLTLGYIPPAWNSSLKKDLSYQSITKLRALLGRLASRVLGPVTTIKIRKKLGLADFQYIEIIAKKYGQEGLREIYRREVENVLKHIAKLVKKLPGKTVITSDHGELLGEDGFYGHIFDYSHPALLEVPWFEVE